MQEHGNLLLDRRECSGCHVCRHLLLQLAVSR
jgi:MinD superfamily P-loop ATPase